MRITAKLLKYGTSINGSINMMQAKYLGLPIPVPANWRKLCLNKFITNENAIRFLLATNRHLEGKVDSNRLYKIEMERNLFIEEIAKRDTKKRKIVNPKQKSWKTNKKH